jgi:hypothetical protein
VVGACMASLRALSATMTPAELNSDGVLGAELWTRLLQVSVRGGGGGWGAGEARAGRWSRYQGGHSARACGVGR